MTSESSPAGKSGQDSVVIASFDSYRLAEHMVASLGREFRKKARKGGATALRGAKEEARAVHAREGHTGSDEQRAHEILADTGQHWVRAAVGKPSGTNRDR